MTKLEQNKCKKLMDRAINLAMWSKSSWEKSEELTKEGKIIDAEIKQRQADQYYGEAEGIRDVLMALNFQHDRMKELGDLL